MKWVPILLLLLFASVAFFAGCQKSTPAELELRKVLSEDVNVSLLNSWIVESVIRNRELESSCEIGQWGEYVLKESFDWANLAPSLKKQKAEVIGSFSCPLGVAFYFEGANIVCLQNKDLAFRSGFLSPHEVTWITETTGIYHPDRDGH